MFKPIFIGGNPIEENDSIILKQIKGKEKESVKEEEEVVVENTKKVIIGNFSSKNENNHVRIRVSEILIAKLGIGDANILFEKLKEISLDNNVGLTIPEMQAMYLVVEKLVIPKEKFENPFPKGGMFRLIEASHDLIKEKTYDYKFKDRVKMVLEKKDLFLFGCLVKMIDNEDFLVAFDAFCNFIPILICLNEKEFFCKVKFKQSKADIIIARQLKSMFSELDIILTGSFYLKTRCESKKGQQGELINEYHTTYKFNKIDSIGSGESKQESVVNTFRDHFNSIPISIFNLKVYEMKKILIKKDKSFFLNLSINIDFQKQSEKIKKFFSKYHIHMSDLTSKLMIPCFIHTEFQESIVDFKKRLLKYIVKGGYKGNTDEYLTDFQLLSLIGDRYMYLRLSMELVDGMNPGMVSSFTGKVCSNDFMRLKAIEIGMVNIIESIHEPKGKMIADLFEAVIGGLYKYAGKDVADRFIDEINYPIKPNWLSAMK